VPVNGRAAVAAVGGMGLQCAAGQGLSRGAKPCIGQVLGCAGFPGALMGLQSADVVQEAVILVILENICGYPWTVRRVYRTS